MTIGQIILKCLIRTVLREAALRTEVPLHSPDFFAGDPYPAYKELRASEPVSWNDVTKFWALLKYEDIRYVSTQSGQVLLDQGHHDSRSR